MPCSVNRPWLYLTAPCGRCREAFSNFRNFPQVFWRFRMFSEASGHVWTSSDPFGCIRMRSDAIRCVWTLPEIFEFIRDFFTGFQTFSDVFGRFWTCLDMFRCQQTMAISIDVFGWVRECSDTFGYIPIENFTIGYFEIRF